MGVSDLITSSRNLGGGQQQPMPVPVLAAQRSPRFHYWLAFFLFSLIVAGASIEATDRIQPTSRGVINQKFAVICSIISFCVSLCVVAMHFSPGFAAILVGSKWEGAVSFIMVALWSALVAVISDPNNGLAVDNEGSVVFGNLYYCGWGGFVCAILLFLNYLKQVFSLRINEELSLRSDRLNIWIGYFIVSIILTSTAATVFDNECLGSDRFGTKFCNRSLLALVDGGAGAAASIVVIGMKFATGVAPWGIELLFSGCLFLSNCFSMGLVTAEDGPGARIGNLYYFSWFSLILPFILMSGTFEYISKRNAQDQKDGAIDLYEEPLTEPLATLPRAATLPEKYPTGDASVAPTEFTSGAESYSIAHLNDRSAEVLYSELNQSQPTTHHSEGATTDSFSHASQSQYGEGESVAGLSYGPNSDPTVFKKPAMLKSQSYASTLDESEQSGRGYRFNDGMDSFASGMSFGKPLGKKSYGHGLGMKSDASGTTYDKAGNFQSSVASFQEPAGENAYIDGEDSYTSGMSLRKPDGTKAFNYGGYSYASGMSVQKPGGEWVDDRGGYSYASGMSLQKPGGGWSDDHDVDSYASGMRFQKPGSGGRVEDHRDASVASSMSYQFPVEGAGMTHGDNDSFASVQKPGMFSGQSYASFACDEDLEPSSSTFV